MQRPLAGKSRSPYRLAMMFHSQRVKTTGCTYALVMKAAHNPKRYLSDLLRWIGIFEAAQLLKTILDVFRSWWRGSYAKLKGKDKIEVIVKDFETYFLMNQAAIIVGAAQILPQLVIGAAMSDRKRRRGYAIGFPIVSDIRRISEMVTTMLTSKNPRTKEYYAIQTAITMSRLAGSTWANVVRDFPLAALRHLGYFSKKKKESKPMTAVEEWREIQKYYMPSAYSSYSAY